MNKTSKRKWFKVPLPEFNQMMEILEGRIQNKIESNLNKKAAAQTADKKANHGAKARGASECLVYVKQFQNKMKQWTNKATDIID